MYGPIAAPWTMVVEVLTKDGTGETVGLPAVLGTFSVILKLAGVVSVARTAAITVILPSLKQL